MQVGDYSMFVNIMQYSLCPGHTLENSLSRVKSELKSQILAFFGDNNFNNSVPFHTSSMDVERKYDH